MKNSKKHLEPGLFDIVLYGRDRKPTAILKYISDGLYEISVLTSYYRVSEFDGKLDFVDPDEGPMIAVDYVLSNEYFDTDVNRWLPEKPTYYKVKALRIQHRDSDPNTYRTVELQEIDLDLQEGRHTKAYKNKPLQ